MALENQQFPAHFRVFSDGALATESKKQKTLHKFVVRRPRIFAENMDLAAFLTSRETMVRGCVKDLIAGFYVGLEKLDDVFS